MRVFAKQTRQIDVCYRMKVGSRRRENQRKMYFNTWTAVNSLS